MGFARNLITEDKFLGGIWCSGSRATATAPGSTPFFWRLPSTRMTAKACWTSDVAPGRQVFVLPPA